MTLSWINVRKPVSETVTLYSPGGKGLMTNNPASLVWRVVTKLLATFVAVTVAPGTTAPPGSVIVPCMDPPPPTCASRVPAPIEHTVNTNRISLKRVVIFIVGSPLVVSGDSDPERTAVRFTDCSIEKVPGSFQRHFRIMTSRIIHLRLVLAFSISTANTCVGPNMFERNTIHF